MRFYLVYHDNTVCGVGITVDVDLMAFRAYADFYGFHAGLDRASQIIWCNAKAFQDFKLALGCGAAVTSHGRDDERISASFFYKIYDSFDNTPVICNSPAAGSDSHAHSRSDGSGKCRAAELLANYRLGILYFVIVKGLSDADHFRHGHIGQYLVKCRFQTNSSS